MSKLNNVVPSIIAPEIDGPLGYIDDPSYLDGSQWYLDDTRKAVANINISSVWNDYTGNGIRIAIIDDGVEYDHSELSQNADRGAGRNFVAHQQFGSNDGDVVDSGDKHGTTVAGVLVADDNSSDIVGITPDATYAAFRIGYGTDHNPQQIFEAFSETLTFDVVNASWGYDGFFYDNFNDPASFGGGINPFIAINDALIDAVDTGRGGLGTVFVMAAGNGRSSGQDTNYHGFTSSPLTITVGGHTSGGADSTFSTPGASVLVAGPSTSILTTDRVGSFGYDSGDIVSKSGTSYAAPVVSGVVSLMLEANPNLGYRDVQEILTLSSEFGDPTDPDWAFNAATNWNGGGRHVSHELGFGNVDAHNAVRLAESWNKQGTYGNRVEHVFNSGTVNVLLDRNEASPYTSTISVGSLDFDLDWVVVDFGLDHNVIGEVKATLTSPGGTTSVLLNNAGNGSGVASSYISEFQLSSVQYWDENIVGDWTLSITDNDSNPTDGIQNVGTFDGWSLTFIGDAGSNDDTYYFTDEWALFGGETARQTISDTTGTDTLNFAAVTGDVMLDLTAGSVNQFMGFPIVIGANTQIENFIGGDGNDTVTGTAASNYLQGWRGNDTLNAGDGDDTVDGGRGDDNIDGGQGYDTAVFAGLLADYTIIDNGDGTATVTDNVGQEGIDSLANIELLQFADGQFVLTPPPSGPYPPPFGGGEEPVIVPTPTHEGTTANSETITGDAGDNVLWGGGGIWDKLDGGDGNDSYLIDTASVVIKESNGDGEDTVYVDTSYFEMKGNLEIGILLANGADLDGNERDNIVVGNGEDNDLDLMEGNDRAYSGDGDDFITVGEGNDFVDGGGDIDTAVFAGMRSNYLVAEQANGVLAVLDMVGADGLNQLVRVEYLQFSDQTITAINAITDPAEDITPTPAPHPSGYVAPAVTIAGTLDDLETLTGDNATDDVLFGGGGLWDKLVGGGGNDTYIIDSPSTRIQENYNSGIDTAVIYAGITTINASIEIMYMMYGAIELTGSTFDNEIHGNSHKNIIDASDGNDSIFGYGGNDSLFGGQGNDNLDGGAGNDAIDGGEGLDTAFYAGAIANYLITENLDGTVTVVDTSGSEGTDLLTDVEAIQFSDILYAVGSGGGSGSPPKPPVFVPSATHTGTSAGSEHIIGDDGDNVLATGGGRWDKLEGGNGDDSYIIADDDPAILKESFHGGNDTLYTSAVTTNLDSNIESAFLLESAIEIVGNAQSNYIEGNDFNNLIDGAGDNDTLSGWGGDDLIRGGEGNDFIDGGNGSGDTALFDNNYAQYVIKEHADGTVSVTDLLGSEGTDRLVRVENLAFADITVAAPDVIADPAAGTPVGFLPGLGGLTAPTPTISGSLVGYEQINGTAANDVLIGGGGEWDTLTGNNGDDSFIIDTASVRIKEYANGGSDTAYIFAADYLTNAAVETFHMMYGSLSLTTGSDDNVITGNELDNVINGGGGNDLINAGAGTDTAIFDGDFSDFMVTYSGAGSTIFAENTSDPSYGVATLTDVELLQFNDQTVDVDSFGFFI